MRYLICLILCAAPVMASDFTLLEGDSALSRDEVVAMTERHLVEFYEGGQSRYSNGGAYSYTYQSGGTAYGAFEVGPDGVICVLFQNGRDRCDKFVRSHGRLVMITQSGERYPIRP